MLPVLAAWIGAAYVTFTGRAVLLCAEAAFVGVMVVPIAQRWQDQLANRILTFVFLGASVGLAWLAQTVGADGRVLSVFGLCCLGSIVFVAGITPQNGLP